MDEFGEAARANMQRLIEEHEAHRREREERTQRGFWNRLLRPRGAA